MALEALIGELRSALDSDRSSAAAELARTAEGVDALLAVIRDRRFGAGRAAAVQGLRAAADNFPERRGALVDVMAETFREGSDASRAAVSALSEADAPRALEEALSAAARLAKTRPNRAVTLQRSVAYGLGLLAARDAARRDLAIPPLVMLLAKNPDNWDAAEALGPVDDDRAFSALLEAVKRRDAGGYAPSLISALANSPRAAARLDEFVAALTRVVHLGRLDAEEAAAGLARFPAGRAQLRTLLRQPPVSLAVIAAVGESGDREAVAPLLDLLADGDQRYSPEILTALGQIGGELAAQGLAPLLDHADWNSWAAARALASMERPGVAALVCRWEDPDPLIRAAVRGGIVGSRDRVIPSLLSELRDGPDLDRVLASRALAALDAAEAAPLLEELLRHDSPVIRLAACDALAALTSPPPVAALAMLLADELPEIRASAATALGHDPEAARRLAGLLADPDARVRVAAVGGLAAVGPSTLPAVRGLLGDPAAPVREAAAVALASLGDDGLAAITAAAASERPDTRRAAAAGAGVIADPAGLELLRELMRDPDAGVRARALLAVPASGGALGADIVESMRVGGVQEREAGASALLRVAAGEEDRPEDWRWDAAEPRERLAGRALLDALGDPSPVVVRAVAAAIQRELASVDPARESLPRWFGVAGDGYRLLMSARARAVIAALENAARRHPFAAAALTAVREALERKLDSRWNEVRVYYASAPSRKPDLDLLKRLSGLTPPVSDRPRYLDATLVHDGLLVKDGQALREGETYDLEVAVRVSPSGISAQGERQPIAEPRQDEEIDLVVVAEGRAGLTVAEPVARLRLPPSGDSTVNAMFRVTAGAVHDGPAALAELRLRLFYQYSLLESAVINAEVVSRFRPHVRSQLELEQPVTLAHDRVERGYDKLDGDIERSLHIDVCPAGHGFSLLFTWEGGPGEPLSLPAPLFMTSAELGDIIEDTRGKLLQVTMGDVYSLSLQPGNDDYTAAMRVLAEAGQDLYTKLFRRKKDSAIAKVGKLLKERPPAPGTVIQVSVAPGASDFLFPWALVYDADVPDETWKLPDPEGFWGLRYCIEQRLPGDQGGAPAARRHPNPQRMTFLLWEQFANSADHRAAVSLLTAAHRGDLEVNDPPINRASAARQAMTARDPGDLYYFYAHAHVRSRDRAAGMLDTFVTAYRRLSPDKQAKAVFKEAYDRAVEAADEPSWIGLTHGHLRLDKLYSSDIDFNNGPLVFINACESSQLTPSLSGDSFVSFFLDRGAAAFLGTECTMTAVFAHPFGQFVLDRLLDGDSIGVALRAARRHFVAQRNPLGLAYTQYGYAGFRLTGS